MVYKKTRLGELTTCETSTFMARGTGEESDTLFISPAYGPTDCPMLATFCWFAMTTSILSIKDLRLPDIDTDWWGREIQQFEGTGIAPAYVAISVSYYQTLTFSIIALYPSTKRCLRIEKRWWHRTSLEDHIILLSFYNSCCYVAI